MPENITLRINTDDSNAILDRHNRRSHSLNGFSPLRQVVQISEHIFLQGTTMSGRDGKPRISANKLAEYLEASSRRRRKIVYDAKYPLTPIIARYRAARTAIVSYLVKHRDKSIVQATIDELKRQEPKEANPSIEALESVLRIDVSMLNGFDLYAFRNNRNTTVSIAGIDVSISPDILVKRLSGRKQGIGLLKLHISRSNILNEESQNIVTMMLHLYTREHLAADTNALNDASISLDVFGKSIGQAPTAYKQRMNNVTAACEEIALWWGKL